MIKPDGVKRRLIGEIIMRLEQRGLIIEDIRLENLSKEIAEIHYGEHRGKDFFTGLVDFIISGPIILMKVAGPEGTVDIVRQMMGATDPAKSTPGSIRGDFATVIGENIIHGSDSLASARRELDLYFPSHIEA